MERRQSCVNVLNLEDVPIVLVRYECHFMDLTLSYHFSPQILIHENYTALRHLILAYGI